METNRTPSYILKKLIHWIGEKKLESYGNVKYSIVFSIAGREGNTGFNLPCSP